MICQDCKGSKIYIGFGLNPPEPCERCAGTGEEPGNEIVVVLTDGEGSDQEPDTTYDLTTDSNGDLHVTKTRQGDAVAEECRGNCDVCSNDEDGNPITPEEWAMRQLPVAEIEASEREPEDYCGLPVHREDDDEDNDQTNL